MIDMEQSDQTAMKILKGLDLSFTVKPVGRSQRNIGDMAR